MRTVDDFQKELKKFEEKFGFLCSDAAQGSAAWHSLKLGVISASKASCAVAGLKTDKRWTYLYELVAQIATGISPEINSKYLDYGREHEGVGKELYKLSTGKKLDSVAFIFKDNNYRCGASPDDIIDGKHGLEFKVPYDAKNYVQFLCAEHVDMDYQWQCQFSMWVSDAESWDFAMFSPTMKARPLHYITMKKDPEMQKKIDDLIPQFISDMDKELEKIGINWGDQWKRLAEKDNK